MKLLLAERIILNVLSFDLIVEQPYNTIITLSQSLKGSLFLFLVFSNSVVSDEVQCAWSFANDSCVLPFLSHLQHLLHGFDPIHGQNDRRRLRLFGHLRVEENAARKRDPHPFGHVWNRQIGADAMLRLSEGALLEF